MLRPVIVSVVKMPRVLVCRKTVSVMDTVTSLMIAVEISLTHAYLVSVVVPTMHFNPLFLYFVSCIHVLHCAVILIKNHRQVRKTIT